MEKKIKNIVIKHIPDYDVDLSWIGTFSDVAESEFAIEHTKGGRNSFKYFNPQKGAVENMEQAQRDYETMMKYDRGELYAIGIKAEAEIQTSETGSHWLINHISSGGLWGIEMGYTGDTEDIKEVETEKLDELKSVLATLGFTSEQIEAANIIKENE